jgi:hypothetical protein
VPATYLRAMRLAVLALASAVAGCGGVPFLVPDTRTAVDHARAVEPKCKGFSEESAAPLLSPSVVDSVDAAYSHVQSGPVDREARLRGARIHVKPLPGFSREMLARNLECHESRVTLGQVSAPADDPYALADSWLDIDVDSEGDGFVILVRNDDMDVARRVLARAQRFAGARPSQ